MAHGIEEAIEGDVCQHEGCGILGYSLWDWYKKEWVHYCQVHMSEHGFCPSCHTNIFETGEDGLCSACRFLEEEGLRFEWR